MVTYENQRIIQGTKKQECDRRHPYTATNNQVELQAMENIKTIGAYKLFRYLCMWSNYKKPYALSSKDVMTVCHITKPTYLKAFKELEALGYLQQKEEGSNQYTFYQIPPEDEEEIIINPAPLPYEEKQGDGFSF